MRTYMLWDQHGNFVNWFASAKECMDYAQMRGFLKFRIDYREHSNN